MLENFRAYAPPFLRVRIVFFSTIILYGFAAALGVATYLVYADLVTPVMLEESFRMTDSIKVVKNVP